MAQRITSHACIRTAALGTIGGRRWCQSVACWNMCAAAQQPFFLERRRLQLQADRQAASLKPQGNAMPPMPARFALTVYRSTRYIASGSSTFRRS